MDKIDRLLDAIEHPDLYSEKDIEAMLSDPDVKEVYDLLDKTKASLSPISTPDVDAEWTMFERSHRKRNLSILNLFSRNAAAGIAIGIASVAAVAAVVGIGVNYVIDKKAETPATQIAEVEESIISPTDTVVVTNEIPVVAPETIVFDDEQFETIVNRIAEFYGYSAEFSTDSPKSLRLYFRWDQASTIDEVVESLNNFEQIHISVNGNTIKIY